MGVLTDKILMPSSTEDATLGDAALLTKAGVLSTTITSSYTPANDNVPYCLVGDILPSGVWCVPYENISSVIEGLAIYDDNNQLITTITSIVSGFTTPNVFVRADHDSSFWVAVLDNVGVIAGNLYQISDAGAILQTLTGVFDTGRLDYPFSTTNLWGFCVSYDGTTVYAVQATIANPLVVYTYDIDTDTWAASPIISIASRRPDFDCLILCGGGNLLTISAQQSLVTFPSNRYVYLYNTSGALITSKDVGLTGDPNEMGVNPEDDTSVWVKTLDSAIHLYTVYQLSTIDLSELITPWGGATLDDGGDIPPSCPLLVFPVGGGPPTPTGTIQVVKVTIPTGTSTEFDFTTVGLTPGSFSLADGETETFSDLPVSGGATGSVWASGALASGSWADGAWAGNGDEEPIYGVTETPQAGVTTTYEVSNGSPHGNISVAEDEIVVVTVTNSIGVSGGIYKIVPGKRNDTLWNEDMSTRVVKIPTPFGTSGFIGD